MKNAFRENAPIESEDLIYVVDRKKETYTFPIHTHEVFELNFTQGGKGVKRIVGDSVEIIDDYDLVLVDGDQLEHGWFNTDNVPSKNDREITIQFSRSLLPPPLIDKKQFLTIKNLLERSKKGVAFSLHTILRVKPLIMALVSEQDGFRAVIEMLDLLHELSLAEDSRTLASNTYASVNADVAKEGRMVAVMDYIHANYAGTVLLHDLAALVNMSDAGFSRYFKAATGMNMTEYVLDYRISRAAWMIVHTDRTISEICYAVGFDNLSYFHRQFKRRKGSTPNEFRRLYAIKHTVL